MKFINRFAIKLSNSKSGQAQIRLLNYLFGFIIVLSLWRVGQVANSPSQEAWGNILRIGQLPIWQTMACNNNNNNNNNNNCDQDWCNHVKNAVLGRLSNAAIFISDAENLVNEIVNAGCSIFPCELEKQALLQSKATYVTALALAIATAVEAPLNPVGAGFVIAATEALRQAGNDLKSKSQAYDECVNHCTGLQNQLENAINNADNELNFALQ